MIITEKSCNQKFLLSPLLRTYSQRALYRFSEHGQQTFITRYLLIYTVSNGFNNASLVVLVENIRLCHMFTSRSFLQYVYVYIHIYINIYVYIYVCIQRHTHTHIHFLKFRSGNYGLFEELGRHAKERVVTGVS